MEFIKFSKPDLGGGGKYETAPVGTGLTKLNKFLDSK